jgi:sodium-dependent phosphate transporter
MACLLTPQLHSLVAVLLASFLEVPVSTTHCKVAAVVFLGMVADGPKNVNWKLFGKILISWVVTLPFSILVAVIVTAIGVEIIQ